MKITTFCIYRKQILLVFNTFCMFMWSTCTLRIRHVVVSHMCRIWYQHDMIRYIWLHWIMLFFQIIIRVDVSGSRSVSKHFIGYVFSIKKKKNWFIQKCQFFLSGMLLFCLKSDMWFIVWEVSISFILVKLGILIQSPI